MRILFVKTSSLGDILQALFVVPYLRSLFPEAKIEWIAEKEHVPLLEEVEGISRVLSIDSRKRSSWVRSLRALRQNRYEYVFDLQGNCKSGMITWWARSKNKVGFGRKSVREWPNLLATNHRVEVPKSLEIRRQYVYLVESVFSRRGGALEPPVFRLSSTGTSFEVPFSRSILVCLGSRWENKKISLSFAKEFLLQVEREYKVHFLLAWGSLQEHEESLLLQKALAHCSTLVPRQSIRGLHALMERVEGIIALDSSALHLASWTKTPTFAFFGPTHPGVFAPSLSSYYWGKCPYGEKFSKQCPKLRTCPTGNCLKQIDRDTLWESFIKSGVVDRERGAFLPRG